MILTCPSCGTQYFADDNTIGDSGRSVKCAACGHSWHVQGKYGDSDEAPAVTAGRAHDAYRARVKERRARKSRLAASLAWIIMATIFMALGASAIIFRNEVVDIWPQSAGAYKAVGLDVNRFGLDFNTIEPTRTFDGTTPLLTVTGSVINISRSTQPANTVRIGLLDENGAEVAVLTAPLDRARLGPGEEATFTARLENPPVAAFELELSFADSDGAAATTGQGGGRVDAAVTDSTEPEEDQTGEEEGVE